MLMKNSVNRSSTVLVAVITIASSAVAAHLKAASPSPSVVIPGFVWEFGSNVNPAPPDMSPAGGGAIQATIAVGEFASGWFSGSSMFGAAQGIWDLGTSGGSITLSNSTGFAAGADPAQSLTVKVTQYLDGLIYSQYAAVSVPGATKVSETTVAGGDGSLGGWTQGVTVWRATANAVLNVVSISGASGGSVIDRLVVETTTPASQLPALSIVTDNGKVIVSWPTTPDTVVLESATELNNPQGWATVQDAIQVSSGTSSVTMDAAGGAKFYRLKRP